jgi:hypothetical protein
LKPEDAVPFERAVESLRAHAVRCRKLAEEATDPEAARALLQLAADIDAAIPILEENAPGRRRPG